MGDLHLNLDKTVDKMVEKKLGVDKMDCLDKLLCVKDLDKTIDKMVGTMVSVDKMVCLDKLLGVKDHKIVDMMDAISSIVQESV
jgi:hypothetical protein